MNNVNLCGKSSIERKESTMYIRKKNSQNPEVARKTMKQQSLWETFPLTLKVGKRT